MKLSLTRAAATAADLRKSAPAERGVNPSQFSAGYGYSGGGSQPIRTDWDQDRAIAEGYAGSTWPFACLDRLGGACSSVPWRVMQKVGGGKKKFGRGMSTSGDWEAADGHPVEQLIERPNEVMSRQFMVNVIVLLLGCGGNSLLRIITAKENGTGGPVELWPIGRYRPVPVDPWVKKFKFRNVPGVGSRQVIWVEGYKRFDRPTDDMLFPEQVVHSMLVDPSNLIWGMSPMRPISPIIDMDRAQLAWNTLLARRFNIPQGAFVDRNLVTQPQMDEAAQRLKERFSSGESGVPLVLGAGAEYIRMGFSPVEADWDVSRDRNMVEVCAAFGVLPSLFISDAKYANQQSAITHMWKNGAHRMLSVIEDSFNQKLIPKAERGRTWIHFDLSSIPDIQDTLPSRLEAFGKAIQNGIPINRAIVFLDIPMDPVDGGDEPLVMGTLVPLEQMLEQPDPGGVDDGEDDGSAVPAAGDSENPAADPKGDPAEEGGGAAPAKPKGAASGTKPAAS